MSFEKKENNFKRFINNYIPKWVQIVFIITFFSFFCFIISFASEKFADFLSSTIGFVFRFIMAKMTSFIKISLFETLLIAAVPLIFTVILYFIIKGKDKKSKIRNVFSILGIIFIFYSAYIFSLGIGYHTTSIDKKLDIQRVEITSENLNETVNILLDNISANEIGFEYCDRESQMGYGYSELSDKIVLAYDNFLEGNDIFKNFKSKVKPILNSEIMSDMGTTGIYTYFTGESNINTAYPDYTIPFVTAHEFAHQRGIIRENEANFIAFLVCINSDDAYIRYSGYLNMFEYVSSALYRTDKDLYKQAILRLSQNARSDIRASNAVSRLHRESLLYKINDKINDLYLKANGTEGVVSYGYVVKLTVAYYSKNNK